MMCLFAMHITLHKNTLYKCNTFIGMEQLIKFYTINVTTQCINKTTTKIAITNNFYSSLCSWSGLSFSSLSITDFSCSAYSGRIDLFNSCRESSVWKQTASYNIVHSPDHKMLLVMVWFAVALLQLIWLFNICSNKYKCSKSFKLQIRLMLLKWQVLKSQY